MTVIFKSYMCENKLINAMVLLLLSHQTVKVLLVESEYWANSRKFTPV